MSPRSFYAIGTPGVAWGESERSTWRDRQVRSRRHAHDVVARTDALVDRFEVVTYGRLAYGADVYPLQALKSRDWNPGLPVALVTGGVHGYETSGVLGALRFAEEDAARYADRVNVLVVPCVSPWAYERECRWNAHAIDPNRQFHAHGQAQESSALMSFLSPYQGRFLLHIDLHETTDSDASEFRPALAARDGQEFQAEPIPDGFYLCADQDRPQLDFQQAVIRAVAQVTPIAPADAQGKIIGSPVVAHGVIAFPVRAWSLCAGVTAAPFATTTEVYPDSARTNPAECVQAQLTAVRAALDFALAHAP